MNMLLIGQKLYSIRIEKGITQAKLVEGTGIPQSALSNIERGNHDITVATLLRLCHALDISPARLFEEPTIAFKKEPLTRRRVEKIAKIVWGAKPQMSEIERVTAQLLRQVLLVDKGRKTQKQTYNTWNELRRIYSEGEIRILSERVRDEENRRYAKRSH